MGLVANAYNPLTGEYEAGGLKVWCHRRLHSKFLSQSNKIIKLLCHKLLSYAVTSSGTVSIPFRDSLSTGMLIHSREKKSLWTVFIKEKIYLTPADSKRKGERGSRQRCQDSKAFWQVGAKVCLKEIIPHNRSHPRDLLGEGKVKCHLGVGTWEVVYREF